MWIVNLALRRPYTFIVLAIFILIAGVLSILSTPKDIFPSINIPVISVIFNFPGLSPRDLEQHLTTVYERVLTTTVDNIEHIESESLFGIAVVKIYLQPNRQRAERNSTGHLGFSSDSQTTSNRHHAAAGP